MPEGVRWHVGMAGSLSALQEITAQNGQLAELRQSWFFASAVAAIDN